MKTRTSSGYVDLVQPIGRTPSGVTYGSKSFDTSRALVEESITWEPGGGRKAYHWCQAYKKNYQGDPNALVGAGCYEPSVFRLQTQSGGGVTCTLKSGSVRYAGSRPSSSITCGPSEDEVMDAISSAAVSLASQPIKPMMNLPQAIIELKDIPKTIKAVPKLARFLKGPGKSLGSFATVKEAASAYLAYTFGVKPTVHDVNNFMGQVPERVGIGVRQVRYKAGQPVRAGFTLRDEDTLSQYRQAATAWSGIQRYSLGASWADVVPVGQANLNSTAIAPRGVTRTRDWPWTADYKIVSREVSGVVFGKVANDYARDFSWMDDMKINADPISTGWELVPFSFVVDWFVDLGRWMREANKLSEARLSGFTLENGVWLSRRDSLVTYLPVCDYRCTCEWDGYHSGDSYPCWFKVETSKVVRHEPYTTELGYSRSLYRDRITFPRLRIKGLWGQSAFQWTTGTALAIQACSSY